MADDDFRTIAQAARAELTVRRSRFIAHIAPAAAEPAALDFLREIRAAFRDASHNVYAYRLRQGHTARHSDDGEPPGTAGLPALNVLAGAGLLDCAVVVTRYFGGTLLGTGGLARAYAAAAQAAVERAGVRVMRRGLRCRADCAYQDYERAVALVTALGGRALAADFGASVALTFWIPAAAAGALGGQFPAWHVEAEAWL